MSLSKSDLEKAKFCAQLCDLVYEPNLDTNYSKVIGLLPNIEIKNHFKYFGMVGFDTQALVLQKDDTIYIVFKGTQKNYDWAVNAFLRFTKDLKFGNYHSGFKWASELSFPTIGSYFLSSLASNPRLKIVLSGHSLGGAMATMYAHIIKQKHPGVTIDALITFGQPRCGNFKFAEYFNSLKIDYKRFVNKGDYIADVPLPIWRGLWSHAGSGFVLSESALTVDNTNYESDLSFRILKLVKTYFLLRKMKTLNKETFKQLSSNHDMSLYLKHIDEEIARK
ncbi:MAG: lipase family protein [Bdellovibrionota bacterium]